MANWTFVEHITDHLVKPHFGDPRQPTLWPSEATAILINDYDEKEVVGACRRATYFRYLTSCYDFSPEDFNNPGDKELVELIKAKELSPDRYMLWIWAAGELFEEYVIKLAKESGVFVAEQSPLFIKEYNISGKRDLIVLNPETGKYRTVEIKSIYGHNTKNIFGTPSEMAKRTVGKPRSSNLMQIALYNWWGSSQSDLLENSSLLYGSRDTGSYSEYEIKTDVQESGLITIDYKRIAPYETDWVQSPISINNVLAQYNYVGLCVTQSKIPDRDFELVYSEEKIQKLYDRDLLGKTDKERHEKYMAYKSGENKRAILPVVKGDWQCDKCRYRNICYDNNNQPNKL